MEQEEKERLEQERVQQIEEQDIVVTGVEEEVIRQEERVSRGLSQVLPQQFHRFVTRGAEAAGSETDLVEVEFSDDEIEVTDLRIPSPPRGEEQQQQQQQQLSVGQPSHPFQQGMQQQQTAQPLSIAASGGRKGLFGDKFYKGSDDRFYCLNCARNYRYRQDINKHVKVCGKDEEPKFTCHVCGAILSSKNSLKENLDRHSKTPSVVCRYYG